MTEAEAERAKELTPTMEAPSSPTLRVGASLREFFFLHQRMAAASHRGFVEGKPGWAEFALGRTALSDAHQLSESGEGACAALILYRSAVILFAQARAARQALSANESQAETELMHMPQVRAGLAALPAAERPLIEAGLATAGEARLANLPEAERQLALKGMRALAQASGDSLEVEAREVRQVRATRRRRLGVGAALLLACVLWPVLKLTWRPNLARDRPVVVTSAERSIRARPRGLVDGNRRNLGFHTKKLKDQSATIDLGSVKIIRSVEVYNRIDCCRARAVPLRLELSTNGVEYTTIERQNKSFLSWTVTVPEVAARFVRLSHEGENFFHLAEVEVY